MKAYVFRAHTVLEQLEVEGDLLAPGADIDMHNRIRATGSCTNHPVEVRWRECERGEVLWQIANRRVGVVPDPADDVNYTEPKANSTRN